MKNNLGKLFLNQLGKYLEISMHIMTVLKFLI